MLSPITLLPPEYRENTRLTTRSVYFRRRGKKPAAAANRVHGSIGKRPGLVTRSCNRYACRRPTFFALAAREAGDRNPIAVLTDN